MGRPFDHLAALKRVVRWVRPSGDEEETLRRWGRHLAGAAVFGDTASVILALTMNSWGWAVAGVVSLAATIGLVVALVRQAQPGEHWLHAVLVGGLVGSVCILILALGHGLGGRATDGGGSMKGGVTINSGGGNITNHFGSRCRGAADTASQDQGSDPEHSSSQGSPEGDAVANILDGAQQLVADTTGPTITFYLKIEGSGPTASVAGKFGQDKRGEKKTMKLKNEKLAGQDTPGGPGQQEDAIVDHPQNTGDQPVVASGGGIPAPLVQSGPASSPNLPFQVLGGGSNGGAGDKGHGLNPPPAGSGITSALPAK